MLDLELIQRAMDGSVSSFDMASQELFGEAMEIARQYATPATAWEELLWAAQLGMEEVLALDPQALSQESAHATIQRKISRAFNGLDHDEWLRVQHAPDAYVNRIFGIGIE